MKIVVRNDKSSRVSDADVAIMVQACNLLLPEVAKAWSVNCPLVVMGCSTVSAQEDDWIFHLVDEDPRVPDALAYHDEDVYGVSGFVLTKTILESGGVPLCHDLHPLTTRTVAAALFHELAEALVDPSCNIWWQNRAGAFIAAEVCDPVQDNNVLVTCTGPWSTVALSDFVYPAWHDLTPKPGVRLCHTDSPGLHKPFQLAKGGYYVIYRPGRDKEPQEVFGESLGVERPHHHPSHRATRRKASMRSAAI